MNFEAAAYHGLRLALENNYRRLAELKKRFGSWQEAWRETAPKKIDLEKEWHELEERGIGLALFEDAAFPRLLREIPFPPFGLYIKGSLPGPGTALAVVGTRKATPQGKAIARNFSAACAMKGITIVSGLALGVDGAAHEGCLETGGKTVAVLGNGLYNVYPKTHENLARRILEQGGALVSEYAPGTPALPHQFLERNRIVAGFADGVLIVEAPRHSGTLATARFAVEQNRSVFVIPGSANHPHYQGSHSLIRQGAELVTEPEHIFEAFGIADVPQAPDLFSATQEERAILEALARNPALPIDKIIELTKMTAQTTNRTLTLLLIRGAVRETGSGFTLA